MPAEAQKFEPRLKIFNCEENSRWEFWAYSLRRKLSQKNAETAPWIFLGALSTMLK